MAGDVVTGIDHQGPQRARQASEPLLAGYEIYCHGEFTAMTKGEYSFDAILRYIFIITSSTFKIFVYFL